MTDFALSDELRYQLLKELEKNPNISQRELARCIGLSLGKTNYCLKAIIGAGWVKAGNFARSTNKFNYAYVLTPKGFAEKAAVTIRFLDAKRRQHENLKNEIALLQSEVSILANVKDATNPNTNENI